MWENFRGCGKASERVVSASDEEVWALQLVVTTSEGVMSDPENILRTSKGVSLDLSRSSEGFSEEVNKKGKEKRLIEKLPYVML